MAFSKLCVVFFFMFFHEVCYIRLRLGLAYIVQFLLLFCLFLLLFMGFIALFDTIHSFHCTISANF